MEALRTGLIHPVTALVFPASCSTACANPATTRTAMTSYCLRSSGYSYVGLSSPKLQTCGLAGKFNLVGVLVQRPSHTSRLTLAASALCISIQQQHHHYQMACLDSWQTQALPEHCH
eukprot:3985853-Amphidinium_carterae.2